MLQLYDVSNIGIQGLIVENTGVPQGNPGGNGISAEPATNVKIYYNTVQDIARAGIIVQGSNIEIVGNEVTRTSQEFAKGYLPNEQDGIQTDVNSNSSNITFLGNNIHEIFGECLGVYAIDGATVVGNRVGNCYGVNVYVSASKNVLFDRNYSYTNVDTYNLRPPSASYRTAGIQLANETGCVGYAISNITITNNIFEDVGQGIRFSSSPNRGCAGNFPDSYGLMNLAFNDINRPRLTPIKFDASQVTPQGPNRIRQNIVINSVSGLGWLTILPNLNGWDTGGNWNYTTVTTTSPGLVDPYGNGYQDAYKLRDDSILRSIVPHSSEPYVPTQDYFCNDRSQHLNSSAGVFEWHQ